MNNADQIVAQLLEADKLDPKGEIARLGVLVHPVIRTTYTRIRWRDDADGDPDAYDEEHGIEDEEEVVLDEYDVDNGVDVADKAVGILQDHGIVEASSSHFYPGIWYIGEPCVDASGWETTYNYHLEDFTPEQEEKIFYKLFPKRQ